MKKIRLHPDLKKQIAKEFKVTYQTVTMSLKFVFESPKAEAIRQRAYELLNDEIEQNKN
ncbi:hypothetical protein K5L04_09495 [Flavobacterium psychrophilum]|uniref:hypothetical protein n=1 Tax=Flavobacterium psychrophilum TaxID=96345 RepID=UPI000B7C3C15|nr:hypothetical protein [Flavobacterium psychrophilum]ELY1979197.1 hypothetical protein [Flavobacterium psychrophilum]MEB3379073.1 hypothetical protein [Flavobacterium psychrophilum]QZK99930.1 hypothetical protein K5L04_09495 [Flavobacterium psychrophilum]SNA64969.1 conserved hypothetical protein [Flavobacterium psychrophilum]